MTTNRASSDTVRVIKSTEQYQSMLNELEDLMQRNPALGTKEFDRLELLSVLIESYESERFTFPELDPVDAIQFRMDEMGLKGRDLVPFFGTKSRVSEVLARKRPLTLKMIRSVHEGLGIPLEVLVRESSDDASDESPHHDHVDWREFPFSEMRKRGYFDCLDLSSDAPPSLLVSTFLAQVGDHSRSLPKLYRRRLKGQGIQEAQRNAMLAWTTRVLIRAGSNDRPMPDFDRGRIDSVSLRDIARLSAFENGPLLAKEYLFGLGIQLVIEPTLRGMLLDGAAMLTAQRRPVIGMTVRFDRIDNFWFTLLHELIHVRDHLDETDVAFLDRTDSVQSDDPLEIDANRKARDALIPKRDWRASQASVSPTSSSIRALAEKVGVHPAVVVGRIHHETGRYNSFRTFLGQGQIRTMFDR